MLQSAATLIHQLEDNSLTLLADALPDVRAAAGDSLRNVSDGDLQVALYTVMLKIIDFLRESTSSPQTMPKSLPQIFLEQAKGIMEYIDGQSAYTVGHTPAVVRHSVQLASRKGLSDRDIADIEYAAWIHNIGMINQAHRLDTLSRSLSPDELRQARNHTVVGAEIIRPIEFLSHLVPVIRHHHTHYNSGEDLPLGARIISLADAYQAMLEPRAYRPALSRTEALLEISKGSGTQFDPDLVPFAHDLT